MATLIKTSNRRVDEAVSRLAAGFEQARDHQHLFSLETLHSWHELEREVETKLEDIQHALVVDGQQAADVALARVEELTRAIDALLTRNTQTRAHHVMTKQLFCCGPADSLHQAAQIMWEKDCGVVPVLDDSGQLVGMITDRDCCMAAQLQNVPLSHIRVESVMARELFCASVDDPIQQVVGILRERQLHRVPIVDAAGRLVGLVSLGDVARYLNGLPQEHPARCLLLPAAASISALRALGV